MKNRFIFALVITSLILAGCSAASSTYTVDEGLTAPSEAPVAMPELAREAAQEGYSLDNKGAYAYSMDQSAASVERLVIKNATLSIAVDDPLKTMDTISKMAEAMGGFVVKADMYQQRLSNGAEVPQVSMTIRVPAERLNEAMDTIKAETTLPIINENLSSEDVTADYTDLNSKLTNLEAAEKQLQEIMASATKTEDVLAVYSQLVYVREQIEVIKGQMLYYERSASLSSISIQLLANAAVQPITIAGWQPKGVAKEALQSLVNTLQDLGSFGIRLVIQYIPTLLLIFGPIALVTWGIVALVKRVRRGRKSVASTHEA